MEYKLNAVGSHALQAPFIYDFYQHVIRGEKQSTIFNEIEGYRRELLANDSMIAIEDFGAGSKASGSGKRKIRDLARSGLSSSKFSKLLFRLSRFMGAKHIVELGTSFGINTLYLARSNPKAKVTTFEGCRESVKVARRVFDRAEQHNIDVVEGNIDLTLNDFLQRTDTVDLVYFDANHQFEATLRYYRHFRSLIRADTVFVLDDIYWSKPMERAWKKLIQQPEVTLSVDVFDAGLLFFNKDLNKEHYVLEF